MAGVKDRFREAQYDSAYEMKAGSPERLDTPRQPGGEGMT